MPASASDVTNEFRVGRNTVTITLRNIWVNKQYSSGLWLAGLDEIPNKEEIDEQSIQADPVDTSTGSHVIDKTLLSINGAQPVLFKVDYNSLFTKEGPLGKGWGHNFETHLNFLANGDIELYWNANRITHFGKIDANNFVSRDLSAKFDTLIKNADGSYTLTRKNQSVYQFNASGQLTEQRNGHGQTLTMSYDVTGRLSTVTEPVSGRSITVSYNVYGLVNDVSETGLNRHVTFAYYYPSNNLYKVTDAKGQSTIYSYYRCAGQQIFLYMQQSS